MSALAALQRRFQDALRDEARGGPPGIAVYRRNALANRLGALAAAYPVVARLVGSAFFGEAARRFAATAACDRADLHELGRGFADFLERYPPAAGLPCLADVARLEWAIDECLRARDGPTACFAAMARLDPRAYGALRVKLHPAARAVASSHAVLAIWEANQPARDGEPGRLQGPDRVLVCREGFEARMLRLDEREWRLLHDLASGQTLAAAAEAFDADLQAFAAALSRLVANGAFAELTAEGGVSPVA